MKRPRVGVDVDGVIGDLFSIMLTGYADLFGRTLDGLTTWDVSPHIPDGRIGEYWAHIGSLPVHSGMLQPYPGAVEGIKALSSVADVYIVTSDLGSCRTWAADRNEWLARHFGVSRKKVIHTDAKYTFAGAMLVDDKPDHIEAWAREHPRGLGVLFAQPYNKAHRFDDELTGRVYRTSDWADISALAAELPR